MAVTLNDGRRLTSDVHAAAGDPASPVSEEILIDKYYRYTQPRLGPARADALLGETRRLAELPDLATFLRLVTEPLPTTIGSGSGD